MNSYDLLIERNKLKHQAALAPLGAGDIAANSAVTTEPQQSQSKVVRSDLFSKTVGKDTTEAITDVLGDSEDNRGLKTAAYLGMQVASGFASSIEGIWDWAASGLTKLIGEATDNEDLIKWSEDNLATDWFDYSAPDEWYKPNTGFEKIAGAVASGIGTTLPSLVAVGAATAATAATSGAASPTLMAALAGTVSGLGAAGNALKEAFLETGELGAAEFGYGALVGATEGAIEGVTSLVGLGTGKVVKAISGNAPKLATKGIAKTVLSLGGDALSEGSEEMVAELLDPVFKRWTYDENAENASAEQVLYAGLIGALSGIVMTGSTTAVNVTADTVRGTKAATRGETQAILAEAKEHSEVETKTHTGSDIYEAIDTLYNDLTKSLEKTNGEVKTLSQRKMLGSLKKLNVSASMAPMMYHESANIINNADLIASRMANGTITDENGNRLTVTADAIREGYEASNPRSIAKAIKTNPVLRALTVSSVSGKIMYNTDMLAQEMLTGKPVMQTELNTFLEKANEDELNTVASNLGVTDWAAETDTTLNNRIAAWNASGQADLYRGKINGLKKSKALEAKAVEDIPVPVKVANGKIVRYKTPEADIAIENDNNTFYVYDVQSSAISNPLTRQQINKTLRQYNEGIKTQQSENIEAREPAKAKSVGENERLAIVALDDGKLYVEAERKVITGTTKAEKRKQISDFFKKLLKNNPSIDIQTVEGDVLTITKAETAQKARDDFKTENGKTVRMTDEEFSVKLRVESHIDEIAEISQKDKKTKNDNKNHSFAKDGFTYRRAYFKDFDGKYYEVTLSIGHNGTVATVYNVGNAKESVSPSAKIIAVVGSMPLGETLSDISIPNSAEKVNTSEKNSQKSTKKAPSKTKYQLEAEQNDALLREKLGEKYTKLTEPNKGMIRKVMRQAKAKGMSEADALMLARVSAHSGVDITVSKEMCMRYKVDESGKPEVNANGKKLVWYADGYYDVSSGKVIVNPEATRTDLNLLIHEFLHASTRASTGRRNKRTYNKLLKVARESLTEEQLKQIETDYGAVYKGDRSKIDEDIIAESSEIFASEQFVNSLISEEPTLFKKMLSFFKGASEYYQDDPRLSKQARRFYKLYKKLYNNLAQQRQNTNASSVAVGVSEERFSVQKNDEAIEIYTEEQYNSFGWARGNDILNEGQNEDYKTKFAKALNGDKSFYKTSSGEFMIPVSDINDTQMEGINNVIVYAKGTIDNPIITRVLEIDGDNETILAELRSEIYEAEQQGIPAKTGKLFKVHYRANYGYQQYLLQRSGNQKARHNNQLGANRGAGGRKATRIKEIRFDENGKVINEERYSLPKSTKPEPLKVPDYEIAYGSVAEQTRPKTLMDYVADAAYSTAHPVKTAKTLGDRGLEWTGSALIGTQIAFVNEQAGYENAMKRMGRTDGEATVQAVRAASNRAQSMLGETQAIKQNGKLVEVGDGWQKIVSRVKRYGENAFDLFEHYLFHKHNVDRMSLEKRSISRNEADLQQLERIRKRILEAEREVKICNTQLDNLKGIQTRATTVERAPIKEKRKALVAEIKALTPLANALQKKIDNFVPEENKPVLGKEVNGEKVAIAADESKAICEKYERDFPWMLEEAEAVYKYLDNLMKERLDAGLISEKLYNQLREKYPHYVPTIREETNQGVSGIGGKYNLEVKKTIKTAKGSLSGLESLDKSVSRMTMQVIKAAEINRMGEGLVSAAEAEPSKNRYIELIEDKQSETVEESLEKAEGNEKQPVTTNQVTIYRGGDKYTFRVTPQVFAAFNAFNSQPATPFVSVELMAKGNTLFKRLVTSLNPFFTVRNFVRDFQDAIFNSKHPLQFVKNYARAVYEISRDGSYWRMYREAGGLSATVFDYDKGLNKRTTKHGFTASENKVIAMITSMERLNMAIEQMPRLAEFISSIEAGSTVNQALLNSADVTTNFARSGKITKHLNRTIIPFLNPAIQGTSKLFRNFSDAFDYKHPRQMVKGFSILALKAAILGIIPQVFNQFLYDDDEDYKNLRDSDKENNYLLKIGDKFFKLPKGRVMAVLAGLANRTSQQMQGEDAEWDEYFSSVVSNLTPVENFSRPIWAPLQDVGNNVTWYGGQIEGQQFDNIRPRDRYDESTSSIAIALGQVFNYSPKKIHYLIDQYSGVIGDFLLPLTTQKAEGNVISGNFTVDPVLSNRLSDEFYDIYEDVQYRKTDGDVTAKYQLKYMNDVKSAISTLYDEKSKIQQSDLSNGEKLQQTRVIQALINKTYQSFLESYSTYTEAIRATQGVIDESDESQVKLRYAEINRQTFGAAKALEEYNSSVYETATMLQKAGISYDTYYNLYFSTLGLASDTDKDGEVITGSKRAKILKAINSTGADIRQQMLFFASKGYSIKDKDFNRMSAKKANKMLISYILSQKNLTYAEKVALAEKCGFKVKNGKIITEK